MPSYTIYADTNDFTVQSASNVFATMQGGSSLFVPGTSLATMAIGFGRDGSLYYGMEGFLSFDTSMVAAGEILGLSLFLRLNNFASGSATTQPIEVREYDWPGGTASWVPAADLASLPHFATTTVTTAGTVYEWAADIASIPRTSAYKLMLFNERLRTGPAPTVLERNSLFNSADSSGTTNDPRLEIVVEDVVYKDASVSDGFGFGGSAVGSRLRGLSASGGFTFGGSANGELRNDLMSATVGFAFGGSAALSRVRGSKADGGFTFGGSPALVRLRPLSASGGFAFGGEGGGDILRPVDAAAAGGFTFAGGGVASRFRGVSADGGFTFGGAARAAVVRDQRPVGAFTVLVQVDGWDPVADDEVSIRAASISDDRVCHLDGQTWWPTIAALPVLRYDLFDGGFGGKIESPSSSLGLAVEPWPSFARYSLADARIRVWTGRVGDAWGDFTLRFDGRVTAQPRVKEGRAEIGFAVDDRWLDQPLLATYAGTTGIEGEAAMKGQPKPLALGAPRFVPATMIDNVNNVIQLSAYGAIEGVELAFERLARFGSANGNSASFAALVSAGIPAGSWRTALASGLVRHGAPPAGRLSYHVKGDKAGPDGWVRKPGAIIKRIALIAGGEGRFDEASLDALDGARPWNISIFQKEQVTARELIQRIAASVNAVAAVDWLGRLFVAPVQLGMPAMVLDATGAAMPPVRAVEQLSVSPPYWRMAIGAERTWDVHPYADVATLDPMLDMGPWNSTFTYRAGNVTQNQDTSWLYINANATSGNPPPTLPATSNAYWRAMVIGGQGNGAWTAIHTDNLKRDGATFTKVDGADGAQDTYLYSDETWAQAIASVKVTATAADIVVGLDTNPGPDVASYTNIDYGFRLEPGGTIRAVKGGANMGSAGSYALNNVIGIEHRTDKMVITKNGVAAYTFADTVSEVTPYGLAASFMGLDKSIGSVSFAARGTPGVSPVLVTVPPLFNIAADYQGNVTGGFEPYVPEVTRANQDIRTSNATEYSITTSGVTATVNNTNGSVNKGTVTPTAMSANSGWINLRVTVDGERQSTQKTTFKKILGDAPQSGGTGAKLASTSSFNGVNSTSYAAVTAPLTVALASGEKLYGTAPLDYTALAGDVYVTAKWQYRLTGSPTWIDMGAGINGSYATAAAWDFGLGFWVPGQPGHGNFNQNKSGLSAGTYELQLVAQLNSAATVALAGVATVEAKP